MNTEYATEITIAGVLELHECGFEFLINDGIIVGMERV